VVNARTNVEFAMSRGTANTAANQRLQVFTRATTPTLGWELRMNRCNDTVNLGLRPASHVQIRCNPDDTSAKQNQQSNYDESKTNGNIQKPWQSVHSIAFSAHAQMELYRLMSSCVFMYVQCRKCGTCGKPAIQSSGRSFIHPAVTTAFKQGRFSVWNIDPTVRAVSSSHSHLQRHYR